MVFRRNKQPGLIGRAAKTTARTALITATATKVAARTAPKAGAAPTIEPAPLTAPVEAASKTAGLTDEAIARIQKLAEMNKAGILTDEEFATQKTRILG